MIALPEGVTVYAGGREWRGEIPAALCPAHYLPSKASVPSKVPPAKATAAEPAEIVADLLHEDKTGHEGA